MISDEELAALARRCAESAMLENIMTVKAKAPETAQRRLQRAALIRSGEVTPEVRAAVLMGEAMAARFKAR